ncbi:MAG: SAM-dependent methyltransferase, partial [Akkermansia sp.]
MMGPNAITLLKELSCQIPLEPSMRVLDLGCGRGLTSAYLADTFGVQVFALDLWIPATENYLRFRELGLDSRIIPLHGDAGNMPFAEEYFDAVVSVDSYHY